MLEERMMYIVDKEHRILYRNQAFREHYPDVPCGVFCYEVLGHRDAVCETCPALKGGEGLAYHAAAGGEWVDVQVAQIEWEGQKDCYAVIAKARPDIRETFREDEREVYHKVIQEQKNALNRQDHILNYIFEDMPGGFHICAPEPGFPILQISNQMLRMLGFTREEIQERFDNRYGNLVYPDDRGQFAELLLEENKRAGFTGEYRYRIFANNEQGYLWVKDVTQICEMDGKFFYQGLILDVTAERENELSLQRRTRELEVIMNSIPGGVVVTDQASPYRYRFISREAAALFGYTVEELMECSGGNSETMIDPRDRRTVLHQIEEGLKDGEYNSRYRVRCKDGSMKYVVDHGKKSVDENGNPCLISLYLDVTKELENEKLIRLQRELIESEKHLKEEQYENMRRMALIQALVEDYGNVFYVDIDRDSFEIYRSNHYIPEYMRTALAASNSYNEMFELYISRTVHEEDREKMRSAFALDNVRRELAQRKSFVQGYRACREDGFVYYEAKCVRVEFGEEGFKAIFGFRDVDEEVRDEMEKKQLLSDALAQAEYANRAKTTFLTNMSHDIRTPMNAIIGFTALASTHLDNRERVQDYLHKITQSSNHLLSLINDVLDMSRIESGKICLEETPENLAEIMHDMRNMIQVDIQAKQLELYIDTVDVTDEDIFCDKLRLNQILLNLLSNAIKFTNPGGMISVRVRQTANAPKGYATYEFRVRDTGIGMSEEFAGHIFEPFTRENTTTVSGIQGTGLGMSITKNIVDMMGGTITVFSEVGKGSEFVVTLDLKLQTEHHEVGPIQSLEGLRSLVVDDDRNVCQSLSKMLRQIGLRAEWTVYGKKAVARTREAAALGDCYQVYIIDWMMPDLNGIETARQIRKIVGDEVPIILLTAYDWAPIEKEAKEAGVTSFVSKPLFLSELRHVLLQTCGEPEEAVPEHPIARDSFLAGRRILLAEDNALNREIAIELLGGEGFLLESAENGKIACEMLTASEPGYYDMILMDVQMPVMDGYEATEAIRAMENRALANIPIIAMTANAFEEDRRKALDCGMDAHVTKPIEVDTLVGVIREVLEAREGKAEAQEACKRRKRSEN
jgi:PAS domain S-box-containing protein